MKLTRRYRFSASHRLHAPALPDADNIRIYGKCNNPFGHGHNYEVEVTVRGRVDTVTGRAVDLASLDALCEQTILAPHRYGNLNLTMAANPTTENLAGLLAARLLAAWPETFPGESPKFEKIRIWETDRNICEVENR